jgi:hypothetical protein
LDGTCHVILSAQVDPVVGIIGAALIALVSTVLGTMVTTRSATRNTATTTAASVAESMVEKALVGQGRMIENLQGELQRALGRVEDCETDKAELRADFSREVNGLRQQVTSLQEDLWARDERIHRLEMMAGTKPGEAPPTSMPHERES